jgi:hypothetical protein
VSSAASNHDEAVLCYVEPPWAYFSTRPLDEQWGDDWNDAPYEHNAGEPYDWQPYMAKHDVEPYEIVKVAWSGGGDLETPAGLDPPNSGYSVEQINAREIAWLTDPAYGKRPRIMEPVVWAGITVSEFIEIIEQRGGTVYVPRAAAVVHA